MVSREKNLEKISVGVNIRIFEERPSGIQNFIRCLFQHLVKSDKYNFLFFSTGNKKIENHGQYYLQNSIISRLLSKIDKRLLNGYFDNLEILWPIFHHRVKIFLAPSFILPIYKLPGVKYLTVIHDLSFLQYKNNPLKIFPNLVLYMKILMPFILKRADKVITPSEFVKNEIIKYYHTPGDQIRVIYEGRDEFFYPEKNPQILKKLIIKYKISLNYLFTNATNHERKNIYGLIDAYKISKFRNTYELVITGLLPTETIANLKKYIKSQGLSARVKYLGFVSKEDLRSLCSFAKIFIYPSFEEGFGLPILEAVACGCLPVCSSAGSLPEIIGEKSLLFNPRDTLAIKNKLDDILSYPKKELKILLNRVSKHHKQFSWQNTANSYIKLFDELLKV